MNKLIKYIVYRDLKADGFNNVYEIVEEELSSNSKVVKDNVIPGMYGYPDMYIRKFKVKTGTNLEEYLIISYTDYELTKAKKLKIMREAIKLIK